MLQAPFAHVVFVMPSAGMMGVVRACLMFMGDHLARSVRGIPCAPPVPSRQSLVFELYCV
ncbi:MAG: hypothetical protein KJ852_00205 [Gammaproteobacteria bacterium]|jgi:hypothetical protein|nr:hypothetical protein [Gammaproteobacteria bacterium]MBU0787972.1 hypothetical protein [Gammaproteobacteria bacterium]MBU0815530.1 hypothetical protein [Gammaproteobacteria bacterium]MBU1785362.1 hypothetical protein [Gammaproteobacteria bacterium]